MNANEDDGHPPEPGELGRGFAHLRNDAGMSPPEDAALDAPSVSVRQPVDDLALKIAELLKASDGRHGLFRRGDEIGTLNTQDGRTTFKVMTARQFRTWLPRTRGVVPRQGFKTDPESGEKTIMKGELTKDQCETILASADLISKLPVLRGINDVKLPVFDEMEDGGFGKLRLLEQGYDPATGIYTMKGSLDYDANWDLDKAVNHIYALFQHFGWRSPKRDFSIHLAAMLTMFGRGLYHGKAPMFIYNANMAGSGKSVLAALAAWLVHGEYATSALLRDQDADLKSTLNAAAHHLVPFIIFDDVDWGAHEIRSSLLNEWITSSYRAFRPLTTGGWERVPVKAMSLMTANNSTIHLELARRALIIDLWNALPADERPLPPGISAIDDEFFSRDKNRSDLLSAMWAIVRDWDKAGRPKGTCGELASFASWSKSVPAMVQYAGAECGQTGWNCLDPSTNEELGDKKTRQYRTLAELALLEFGKADGEMQDSFEISVQQLAGVARRNAVATFKLWPEMDIESVKQTEGQKGGWKFEAPAKSEGFFDPDSDNTVTQDRSASEWLNAKTRSSFGNAMKDHLHEKQFKGPHDLYYLLEHRKNVTPARYTVTRVKAAKSPIRTAGQ